MPIEVNGIEHQDKSKEVSLSFTKGNDKAAAFGSMSVEGLRDDTDFPKHNGPSFNSASASLGVATDVGHSASVTATHIPDFGNQITNAVKVNVLKSDNHKVDVNAFTTRTIPSGPFPNYSTHGAGVQYQYKDVAHAAASAAHVPIAKRTDYSISTGLKLHETPTSSFSANIGASKSASPFAKGDWQPNGFFIYRKKF